MNVTDIKDESGYIEALGKEAAAKAINDARKSVAEKVRDGSIGEANAHQEQRVKVASADAMAVEGKIPPRSPSHNRTLPDEKKRPKHRKLPSRRRKYNLPKHWKKPMPQSRRLKMPEREEIKPPKQLMW